MSVTHESAAVQCGSYEPTDQDWLDYAEVMAEEEGRAREFDRALVMEAHRKQTIRNANIACGVIRAILDTMFAEGAYDRSSDLRFAIIDIESALNLIPA